MTNAQLEEAIGDMREMLNEIYNEQAEMKVRVKQLRALAGLETVEEKAETAVSPQ
jgi:regulator of replication initiation timing